MVGLEDQIQRVAAQLLLLLGAHRWQSLAGSFRVEALDKAQPLQGVDSRLLRPKHFVLRKQSSYPGCLSALLIPCERMRSDQFQLHIPLMSRKPQVSQNSAKTPVQTGASGMPWVLVWHLYKNTKGLAPGKNQT